MLFVHIVLLLKKNEKLLKTTIKIKITKIEIKLELELKKHKKVKNIMLSAVDCCEIDSNFSRKPSFS
jgi:hypothetical protein